MATRAKFNRLVAKAALRIIPLEAIKTDPAYQRQVRRGHLKIVAEFDETALGIPLIAERDDGSLWVVDGLQRITALRKLGHATVRAEVFHSTGQVHEAEVFKLVNANRTKLGSLELFKALITGHDITALAVKQTAEAAGFKLPTAGHARGPSADYLTCISTAYTSVRVRGTQPLAFALRTIRAAWPGDPAGTKNRIVEGLCSFYVAQKYDVDEARLVERLRGVPPHKILYTATLNVGGVVTGIIEILTRLYTRKNRKPRA